MLDLLKWFFFLSSLIPGWCCVELVDVFLVFFTRTNDNMPQLEAWRTFQVMSARGSRFKLFDTFSCYIS